MAKRTATGGEQEREFARDFFLAGYVLRREELAFTAHETCCVHDVHASVCCVVVAWPLQAGVLIDLGIADTAEAGCERGNLFHDLFGMRIVHLVAQGFGQLHCHFPIGQTGHGGHGLAHTRDAALGVGEGAVFFQEGRAR